MPKGALILKVNIMQYPESLNPQSQFIGRSDIGQLFLEMSCNGANNQLETSSWSYAMYVCMYVCITVIS